MGFTKYLKFTEGGGLRPEDDVDESDDGARLRDGRFFVTGLRLCRFSFHSFAVLSILLS